MGALLASLLVAPAGAATEPVREPVVDGDWPDPEVVRDPATGRWYSFATNFAIYGVGFNVPVKSSADLVDWSAFHGDALPDLPAWVEPGHTWAPGVARIGAQWVLWFTARHAASGRQCLGVATSSQPAGPYAALGAAPAVCQYELGGSIDARPFLDPATGTWWLHWKSDENAPGVANPTPRIWAAPLTPAGTGLAGPATEILRRQLPIEGPVVEAPAMVHTGGAYWLFYAGGDYGSAGYHTHVAGCAGPAGPCTRIADPNDPFLGPGSLAVGPGGASVAEVDGGRWAIVFHGWKGGIGYQSGNAYRATYLETITFDGPGGAPRLRPDLSRVPAGVGAGDGLVPDGAAAPTVVGAGAGRVEAWRTADGRAWLRYGGTAPRSWGGILRAGPDVARTAAGVVVLAGAAPDRSIWLRTATTGWRPLGGLTDHAPAVVASGSNRLDVFVTGVDDALWHRASADGGASWTAWIHLGGILTDAPDVTAGAGLDVVGRGSDGAAWLRSWRGSWSPWRSLGGSLRGAPSIATAAGGEQLVVARGVDDGLYLQRSGTGWGGWYGIGGRTGDRPGLGGSADLATLVVRGVDGRRWRNDVVGGVAGGWFVDG